MFGFRRLPNWRAPNRRYRPRLRIEVLEDRQLLSVAPDGPEFAVNTYTTNGQSFPAVATDADGDFVVVWQSDGQDGDGYGIYAQRYDAAGIAQGGEFQVNSYTTGDQWFPTTAMDADGDFVVVWTSGGQDGSLDGVYAQRYDAAGIAQGGEFRVNTHTTSTQSSASVSMDADGDFVVAWRSLGQPGDSDLGVYAQRYNAAGVAQGSEFRVNTHTTSTQSSPSVSMDADGDFVVAWQSFSQDGSFYGVYAQRYDAAGVAQGGELQVNSYTTSNQWEPEVAMDEDGDFAVVWRSDGQDGSDSGIYARRYDANGVAQGGEFAVNTYTTDSQRRPSVRANADGDFVVAWHSDGQDGNGYGIYAQRYDAAGAAQASPFRVSIFTTANQWFPAVAADADGDFVMVWRSDGQDGSVGGIFAQRYASVAGLWIPQGPAPTLNGQIENVSPSNQVTGAIHTVLAHPTDVNTLYIGAVNGGIWKTSDATSENPTWAPQTDFLTSLSIGAMAFDPTDATHNTLLAGTAKYSSFGGLGGDRGPVYRTTDGGSTWVELVSSGLKTFGENISGIAARGSTIVVTSSLNSGGIFRSTDTGANFTPISDEDFVSPNDNFTDLVVDPSDVTGLRLYAANEGSGSNPGGIYRSDDFGATWTKITGAAINGEMHDLLTTSNNIEMAVHPTTGRLYVAVLVSGQPRGIFHSNDATATTPTWTRMDVPLLPTGAGAAITNATNTAPIQITSSGHGLVTGDFIFTSGVTGNTAANGFFQVTRLDNNTFSLDSSTGNGAYAGGGSWAQVTGPNPTPKIIEEPGAQGRIHFSIVVDPTDQDILYVGGDRQDFPNLIGAATSSGALFRGDASIAPDPTVAPSPQWDHLTHDVVAIDLDGGTASGSAPHADSREMTFDAAGNLIEVDDGGIFKRTSPRDNTGDWFSLAGTLGVVEFHDIAYDSNSDVLIGGTQDNGTHVQVTPSAWTLLSGGDGGDVAVDNVTLAGSNQSIRYSSFRDLGIFRRTVWDANNDIVSSSNPALTLTSGVPLETQFKTPVELNRVDPRRILFVGGNAIYESTNEGATIAQIGGTHSVGFSQDAVTYGGFQNGVPNQDVFYVGAGDVIRLRTSAGGPVTTVDPDLASSDSIRDVVTHADDWTNVFAIDDNQVFHSTNSGSSWTDITGNLMSIAGAALQTIEFVPGPIGALVVGANLGVFTTLVSALGTWTEVGANLPNALVYDLRYNSADDVLVAGTLGRGAWKLPSAGLLGGASVVGRHLFYNQSKYDGNSAGIVPPTGGANNDDSDAIATDKSAYLPGSGLITPASMSAYTRGINGIMIDLAGAHGTLSLADFEFSMSEQGGLANNIPSTWVAAPAPVAFTVLADTPAAGTDRIEFVWANGAIENRYLEVTVKGNDTAGGFNTNTGLVATDIFYFGNRVGDDFLGTPPATFNTTAGDEIDARNNPGFLQPLTNIYDYNKDSLVSAADQIAARNNAGFLFRIDISDPPAAPEGPDSPASDDATSAVASALGIENRPSRPDPSSPPEAPPAEVAPSRRSIGGSPNLLESPLGQTPHERSQAVDEAIDNHDFADDDLLDELVSRLLP